MLNFDEQTEFTAFIVAWKLVYTNWQVVLKGDSLAISINADHHLGIELSACFWREGLVTTTSTSFAKSLRKIIPPTLHPILCTHIKQDTLKLKLKLKHEHD